MILQNIWRWVIGYILINISPSNVFPIYSLAWIISRRIPQFPLLQPLQAWMAQSYYADQIPMNLKNFNYVEI